VVVQLFRFDEGIAIPVSDLGSRFKMAELTGEDSHVRVHVMHLPPGGLVGRHLAGAQQLFAVVVGTGWVSGLGGERRDIRPGYAALWDAGEEHEAGTDDGLMRSVSRATSTCGQWV
jgi:quercetin dioxygenase-like cupin family protein